MKKKTDKETPEETPEEVPEETAEFETDEIAEEETAEPEVDALAEKDAEISRLKDEMLRVRAEAENFRRRMTRDKEDAIQFANEKLIKELVPVFDNLHRALEAPDSSVENLKQGVQMIADQFLALLKKQSVEQIQSLGEKFDPTVHEVLNQVESGDHEEDTVVQEYCKGYKLKGRVLIPAKVATSRKPAAPSKDDQDNPAAEKQEANT